MEFINSSLHEYFASKGVVHQKSRPYIPQQNGVAERKHRSIVDTTSSLLYHAPMPLEFWYDAFSMAVFLINGLPSSSINFMTPFQTLFGYAPDLKRLRVFGCACYPSLKPYNSHKLQPKTIQHVFMGYTLEYKGYLCYNIQTKKMFVSRHVIFHEDVFLFANLKTPTEFTYPSSSPSPNPVVILSLSQQVPKPVDVPSTQSTICPSPTVLIAPNTASPIPIPSHVLPTISVNNQTTNHLCPTSIPETSCPNPLPHSRDFPTCSVLPNPSLTTNNHPMVTRSKSRITKRKDLAVSSRNPKPIVLEPSSFTAASKVLEWKQAMLDEFLALKSQNTWSLAPPTNSMNNFGCKWVFRIEFNPYGFVACYKAPLVAKRYNQLEGVDFDETFNPVVKKTTVRIVLNITAHFGWSLQ